MSSSVPPPGRSWRGIAIGAGLPLLAFLLVIFVNSAWWVAQLVWAAVLILGVAFQFHPRTKRLGTGMLLGFLVLLVVGAGTCTVAVVTLGLE